MLLTSKMGGAVFDLGALFGRHEIDGWRDDYVLAAAATLHEVAARVGDAVDPLIAAASHKDVFVLPGRFLSATIAPLIRAAAEPAVERVMTDANAALGRIVTHQAVWHRAAPGDDPPEGAWEGFGDVAMAAAPLAAGATLAAALPGMAITTTAGWFGLIAATTTISWPVAVVGGAAAAAGLATGVLKTSHLRDRFEARLRGKARALAGSMLLKGTAKEPAVLEQLIEALNRAVVEAKKL